MRLVGRDRTLWGAAAIVLLGGIFIVTGHSGTATIFGAWLIGYSGSLLSQTNTTIMADRFKENRAVAITESNISGSLFCCIAPILVSLCVRTGLGWRAVFILPMLLFSVLYFRFKNVAHDFRNSAPNPVSLRHLPPLYWAYWTIILLSVAGEWSIIFWATDFMTKVDNFSKADASAAVSVFLVAMLIGRIAGSRLSNCYHVRQLLPISAILGFVGFLIFWLTKLPLLNLTGLFLAGLGDASVYPLTFALAIGAASNQTNRSTCKLSLASGIANLVTPLLMGLLADHRGISAAYGVVFLLWGMAIILIIATNKLAQAAELTTGSLTAETA
jgi:fucose permease